MVTLYSFEKLCESNRLALEIAQSSIITALDRIETSTSTSVYFKDALSSQDESTLDSIITAHVATPLEDDQVKKVVIQDNSGNIMNQLDTDNAMIVRTKAAKKGWSFWAVPIEVTTALLSDNLYCKDYTGADIQGLTYKIYDSDNVEITTPGLLDINLGTCVKTVVDFEPQFDYEMIGGSLRINNNPATDVRLWIVGAPDIPAIYGGSKEFASGINLKFMAPDSSFEVDGRVTKYISYSSVNHSGKLRLILKHSPGTKINMQFIIHLYRL